MYDLKLIDKSNMQPNKPGGILLGLLAKKKYPPGDKPTTADIQAVKRLRTALRLLTGISGDPFYGVNSAYGWKPRFKLIDKKDAADERAKEKVRTTEFNDAKTYNVESNTGLGYDWEDDEAGEFLKQHDYLPD